MNDHSTHTSLRILIVEDEFIIGEMIARRLAKLNHHVVGQAFSSEEAKQLYDSGQPELVLLDIRLRDGASGIEFGEFLHRQQPPVPHIYLTSQVDPATLARARNTHPSGYLSRPVQIKSLLATIDIAMHNFRSTRSVPTLIIRSGRNTHLLPHSKIQYIQADHVYVSINMIDRSPLIHRMTLTDALAELAVSNFIQTHRSYIVNLDHITRYDRECVYIGEQGIPVSRGRREEVFARLRP